jgi:hypothetical protein
MPHIVAFPVVGACRSDHADGPAMGCCRTPGPTASACGPQTRKPPAARPASRTLILGRQIRARQVPRHQLPRAKTPTGATSMQSLTSQCDRQHADIDRCRREIAAIKAQILAGQPDLPGLCLALADWSGELRLLQASRGLATVAPRLAHVRSCGDGLACRPKLT